MQGTRRSPGDQVMSSHCVVYQILTSDGNVGGIMCSQSNHTPAHCTDHVV